MFEIEHDGFLAGVHTDESGRHAVIAAIGTIVAQRVATAGRFDLDDFGAEVTEKLAAERSGQQLAEFEDAYVALVTGAGQGIGRAIALRLEGIALGRAQTPEDVA